MLQSYEISLCGCLVRQSYEPPSWWVARMSRHYRASQSCRLKRDADPVWQWRYKDVLAS